MSVIDEYIEKQEKENQKYLKKIKAIIDNNVTDCDEIISYGMPTWKRKTNIIHMAANKKHIGIYPGGTATTVFKEDLEKYNLKYTKGSIHIPYSKNLPTEFIKKLVIWCNNNN